MENRLDINKVREVCADVVVLYVEDELDVRTNTNAILELFFNHIYLAEDGEQGLEIFQKHNIDLVISDIQMPCMNGLDMIEKIREVNPDIPVVITTAFNEQKYFLQSIELKVDKYLIKPIQEDSAEDVFYRMATMISDRRKAKELEIRNMQSRINRISEHIVAEIAESYQNPCIIYSGEKIRYINDAFCSLFDSEELEKFLDQKIAVEDLFDDRKGYMRSLDEYDKTDIFKNRVSISKRQGRKIYRVLRKLITIDEDANQISEIYMFSDVTLEEYQKIKIKSYSEILEELVVNTRYRNRTAPAVEEKEFAPTVTEENKEKLTIKDDENDLLRRSHVHKTSAQEYVTELDDEILMEMQELPELNKDFAYSISVFKEEVSKGVIDEIAKQLEHYAHEISLLFEFADLAYAIRSLAVYLRSLDENRFDEKLVGKLSVLLEGIQSDLYDWNQFVFIENSAIDIHYLDSSLFSACLQIELVLSDDVSEMESEEDDFILF